MKPDNTVIKRVSTGLSATALVQHREAYAVYIHVPVPKKPKNISDYLQDDVRAELLIALPTSPYRAEWIDTKSGETVGTETFKHSGGERKLTSPTFANDIAVRIVRSSQ